MSHVFFPETPGFLPATCPALYAGWHSRPEPGDLRSYGSIVGMPGVSALAVPSGFPPGPPLLADREQTGRKPLVGKT
jgi:hypothetical protein